jgi:hypothetical protein
MASIIRKICRDFGWGTAKNQPAWVEDDAAYRARIILHLRAFHFGAQIKTGADLDRVGNRLNLPRGRSS